MYSVITLQSIATRVGHTLLNSSRFSSVLIESPPCTPYICTMIHVPLDESLESAWPSVRSSVRTILGFIISESCRFVRGKQSLGVCKLRGRFNRRTVSFSPAHVDDLCTKAYKSHVISAPNQ